MSRTWVLILLCVLLPPVWGGLVEWLFRRWRGDRPSRFVRSREGAQRGDV